MWACLERGRGEGTPSTLGQRMRTPRFGLTHSLARRSKARRGSAASVARRCDSPRDLSDHRAEVRAILSLRSYYLGCPFWSFGAWNGSLYTRDARPQDRLAQYGRVFNSVEGNTTFWSVPSADSVRRWADAVDDDFRFCFKLPRTITHEAMLCDVERDVDAFLHALEPMGERLGPVLIQLPPAFGPNRLDDLERLLRFVPSARDWAVELRHLAFFDDAASARTVDELLVEHGCDRVVMDTRALRSGDPEHPEVRSALHEKPDLPLRPEPLGRNPLVRFVGHPTDVPNDPYLDEWAGRISGWIESGKTPYFFMHTASNRRTPEFARDLHRRIAERIDVGELSDFPGERGERADGQLALPGLGAPGRG